MRLYAKFFKEEQKMLGIYENAVRESIENGSWLDSLRDCNFSTEWSRLICEAGRWCESYASDLMIGMDSVRAYLIGIVENMEKPENREFWFGFRQSGVDGLSFIQSKTEREYASHVYRAIWRWSFTFEEREYGPYMVSKLEKLLVI